MTVWFEKNFTDLEGYPFLRNIKSNKDGLFLTLSFHQKKNVIVFFEEYSFFRNIDEGLALETYSSGVFSGDSQMFITEQSELIDWFNQTNSNAHEKNIRHYVIPSQEDITEILATCLPKISKPFDGDYLGISLENTKIWASDENEVL